MTDRSASSTFRALTTFTGTADVNHLSILQASNGATVLDANLASISGMTIPVSSGTLSFPALTHVVGSDLIVSGGASLTLPVLTGYTGTAIYTTTLEATGSGSLLSIARARLDHPAERLLPVHRRSGARRRRCRATRPDSGRRGIGAARG